MCLSGEGPLKGKEVLLSVIAGSISYGLNNYSYATSFSSSGCDAPIRNAVPNCSD